jgi:hypothetical protein
MTQFFPDPIGICFKKVEKNHANNLLHSFKIQFFTVKNNKKKTDLHGLAESHGVGEDAAKARAGAVARRRFDDIVVKEAYPTNLHNITTKSISKTSC